MNETTQPQRPAPCPLCGGEQVFTTCTRVMGLVTGTFDGVPLNALACTYCGYTQFFAEDPQKLRKLLK